LAVEQIIFSAEYEGGPIYLFDATHQGELFTAMEVSVVTSFAFLLKPFSTVALGLDEKSELGYPAHCSFFILQMPMSISGNTQLCPLH
jgi:hypothetical protein